MVTVEHYTEVSLKSNSRHTASVKTDALTNSVYNTLYYGEMTGDIALLSSRLLILRLCEPAERVCNTLVIKQPPPPKKKEDRSGDRSEQEMPSFLEKSLKRMHGGQPTSDPSFY